MHLLDEALHKFAQLFKQWEKDGHTIWAFFNNDYFGYATQNGLKLIEMLDE